MGVFSINYKQCEDRLSTSRAKAMIGKEISGNLVPSQMYAPYKEFGITHTSMWSDVTFNQAMTLLDHCKQGKLGLDSNP